MEKDTKKRNDAYRSAESCNQINYTEISEKAQEESVRSIPPYKLAELHKLSNQILDKLISQPRWLVSYDDIIFVLELLLVTVKKARDGR